MHPEKHADDIVEDLDECAVVVPRWYRYAELRYGGLWMWTVAAERVEADQDLVVFITSKQMRKRCSKSCKTQEYVQEMACLDHETLPEGGKRRRLQ